MRNPLRASVFDAHVLHKIGLAVEVCPVHVIKIDKAQMAYPDAGKTHGDIGAKATETADGDKASVQFFLDLFPMALAKGAINGACHWIRCIPRGENCRFSAAANKAHHLQSHVLFERHGVPIFFWHKSAVHFYGRVDRYGT